MDQPELPAPIPSLREALEASGARPNSRLSPVSRFMFDHYDEVHALKVVERYSWRDIVAEMTKLPEFMNAPDGALTVAAAKLAWSRVSQRKRQDAAGRSGAIPRPDTFPEPRTHLRTSPSETASEAPPQERTSLQDTEERASGHALGGFHVHPGHPHGSLPPANASETPAPTLSETEVSRRIAEVAARQGGTKIPLVEIL